MRIVIGAIGGIAICLSFLFFLNVEKTDRDLAIVIHIYDDSKMGFTSASVITDKGFRWSCSFIFEVCTIAIFRRGDIGYQLNLSDASGNVYSKSLSHQPYAEPGSTHIFQGSTFEKENT